MKVFFGLKTAEVESGASGRLSPEKGRELQSEALDLVTGGGDLDNGIIPFGPPNRFPGSTLAF